MRNKTPLYGGTSRGHRVRPARPGWIAAAFAAALQAASVSSTTQAADLPLPHVVVPMPQFSAPKIVPRVREPTVLVPPVDHVATPAMKRESSAPPSDAPKTSVVAEPTRVAAVERPASDSEYSEAALWFALLMLVLLGLFIRRLVEAAFAQRPVPLEALTRRSIAKGHRPTEDELLGALFDTLNGRSGRDLERARARVRQLAGEISNLNRSNNRS